MTGTGPILLWFRRDLRLSDHVALDAAARTGRPVIPVFLYDPLVARLGAAPKWRLGLGVARFERALETLGSRLILRRGDALAALRALIAETGATAVWWSRAYDPGGVARDRAVKAALTADGIDARGFPGHLLFEPWTVETGTGGFYRVYSPFWRTVRDRDPGDPLAAPARLEAPAAWPAADRLADWRLGAAMDRGAAVVAAHARVGEEAARDRLAAFLDGPVGRYRADRDFPARPATSGLSENLTCGEISPRQVRAGAMAAQDAGAAGAEHFLRELVWREFAYHLAWHTPHLLTGNWRPEWDGFPWSMQDGPAVLRWKQGRSGIPLVDAAMRQLHVTGTMHNRGRMVVASYLTKHMLTHWRIGLDWFADTLIDWDPAANALGWQWAAGSGPDAAPYFRIFNPETQAEKFDPDRAYVRRWVAELSDRPGRDALAFFDAIPRRWGLSPGDRYPAPVTGLAEGRARALAAFESRRPGAAARETA
jgi:deoxyribodipyrimidine photo-lyase